MSNPTEITDIAELRYDEWINVIVNDIVINCRIISGSHRGCDLVGIEGFYKGIYGDWDIRNSPTKRGMIQIRGPFTDMIWTDTIVDVLSRK